MARKIPDKLSEAAKQRYIHDGDGTCPFCKNEFEVDYEPPESLEGFLIEQIGKCGNCSHRWVEVYELTKIYTLNPDGTRE